ncbi:uncharacterized protein LOC133464815 [Cololabis saira]|uniref:uncharacterized protein LOC133464815 n=1 Tax=Cololabis saira TaxID=129043 RepID=UPI002AD547EE|nr:uncharacterized protein LOC133464815 [Cololabis saira]
MMMLLPLLCLTSPRRGQLSPPALVRRADTRSRVTRPPPPSSPPPSTVLPSTVLRLRHTVEPASGGTAAQAAPPRCRCSRHPVSPGPPRSHRSQPARPGRTSPPTLRATVSESPTVCSSTMAAMGPEGSAGTERGETGRQDHVPVTTHMHNGEGPDPRQTVVHRRSCVQADIGHRKSKTSGRGPPAAPLQAAGARAGRTWAARRPPERLRTGEQGCRGTG